MLHDSRLWFKPSPHFVSFFEGKYLGDDAGAFLLGSISKATTK